MDKVLIKQIIEDFESISNIINIRLKQLYSLLGESNVAKTQIKQTIESQKSEVSEQIEKMRQQAMEQVNQSIRSIQSVNIPNINGTLGQRPMFPDIEKLKKNIGEK